MHPMKELVALQKKGIPFGICSVCSANELVLKATMKRAREFNTHVLIEATANQVNQNGGYTGMMPVDFVNYVKGIADSVDFPFDKIILGGDHLGPLTWSNLNEAEAMANAKVLVEKFVSAGFTKIHLDTSMKLKDDPVEGILQTEVIARRGAELAQVCHKAYRDLLLVDPSAQRPVYVIGSEVPIPGGAQEEEETVQVTRKEDLHDTIREFKEQFLKHGISELWEDVIAVVVQPGVEFGDDSIHEYKRHEAEELVEAIKDYPTVIFEGHSTDYQTPTKLKEMVEDQIAILKVGPAVTFALREGLFALSQIENEIVPTEKQSNFIEVIEEEMLSAPQNWQKHYHGNDHELKLARKYSFSDRMRYYIGSERVSQVIETLLENLSQEEISLSLLSQYCPIQYQKIRKKQLDNHPHDILLDSVVHVLDDYYYAVLPDSLLHVKSI